jgi:glycosyltransferase involved in cell wall biosynthesis
MQPPGLEFPVNETPTYWIGYSWSVLRHLNRLIQSTKFDLIDFAEYGAEGFAYQLDRSPENWVPVVVQLHGPLSMFSQRIGWPERGSDLFRIGTLMEDVSIKRADAVMACSANIAEFTANFHGVPRETIKVVHCGVDYEAFQPENGNASPNDRPTVLFVGNITLNKGVKTVFDAVLRLRSKYPDIRLQILGKADDDFARELQSEARRNGADANIEMPGFMDRNKIVNYYQCAHVFASPAQHEPGVANVYLEAMASGCPIVASNTGAAPEAVIDGETGLLVRHNDIASTAAALDRILGDESLRRSMGEAGRKRIEEHFTMGRYIQRILTVYQTAIEGSQKKVSNLR